MRRSPDRHVILGYRPTSGMLRCLRGERPFTQWDCDQCRRRGLLRDDLTETDLGTLVLQSEARRLEISHA